MSGKKQILLLGSLLLLIAAAALGRCAALKISPNYPMAHRNLDPLFEKPVSRPPAH